MKEDNQNLKFKQERTIMALLTEPTYAQAAKAAGIGETTIYRWLDDDEFSKAFKSARKKAFSQSVSHLQQVVASAVQTLKDVMEDPESPASSRVTAAKAVIEMAYKAYEMEDMAAELDAIKEYIEANKARS